MKNARFVWPALFLIVVVCPALAILRYDYLAYAALAIGILIIVFAMATGRLRLFG